MLRAALSVAALAFASLILVGAAAGRPESAVCPPGTCSPEPPRAYVDTTHAPPGGRTIAVAARGNLQAALNAAQPGDIVELQAGATFTGNFVLPAKTSGTGWIYVRSSAWASLPPPGTRVTPAQAALMPKIVTPNDDAAIYTAPGAHHYRFVGIELTANAPGVTTYAVVRFDGASLRNFPSVRQTAIAHVPHDLVIDRCYVHGAPAAEVWRGVILNSAASAVVDSHVADFHSVTADSQAIVGWNGPGPFKIVNNELEAAGENVMFGGGKADIADLVPSDIEIRHNRFAKPLKWRLGDPLYAGQRWVVKNHLEFKNARRVLVEGNLFEDNWAGQGQSGQFLVITPRAENGSMPWAFTGDIAFQYNVVRRSTNGAAISGTDGASQISSRILIKDNLLDDIGAYPAAGAAQGQFLAIENKVANVTIDHNTVVHAGTIIYLAGSRPMTQLTFTNNIVAVNRYGVVGDGSGNGAAALDHYCRGWTFSHNVVAGPWPSSGGATIDMYPARNSFPDSIDAVRFADRARGDYRLAASSPFRSKASDGRDVGADLAAIARKSK